jgi:F0F1-type ATP synthase assembly protein I
MEDLLATVAAQKAEALCAAEAAKQAQRMAWYAAVTVLVAISVLLGVAIGLVLDVGSGPAPTRPQTNATARR